VTRKWFLEKAHMENFGDVAHFQNAEELDPEEIRLRKFLSKRSLFLVLFSRWFSTLYKVLTAMR